MDLGSNIGIQVKKFYEPENYPLVAENDKRQKQIRIQRLYTEAFGNQYMCKISTACTLGFEPNPKHYKRLQYLEQTYNAKGRMVHFFHMLCQMKIN